MCKNRGASASTMSEREKEEAAGGKTGAIGGGVIGTAVLVKV